MRRETNTHEEGIISIDFATAIVLFLFVFFFVFYSLSGVITPYESEYNRMYPIADRAADVLMKDPGEPSDWESNWEDGDYTGVSRIGFATDDESPNVLSELKINTLMTDHSEDSITWWEYSVDTTSDDELDNATRALGLEGYNFYMQIRPTNETLLDMTEANNRIKDEVPDLGDVVQIERLALLKDGDGVEIGRYKMILWVW